ncbi:TNF receptor-associated factor 6-like [Saccoglossus kowalevskii]|uniref:TNF receptor-associated factor 6-like isoform X1 n=1 Tax=Saccoglossus kowalevskii TaxID=10224 RepID=A0ABM0M0X1_SACKO|nr:PREDICTED: TNF receptor-associated factor 6-like isoform X1 [Saccoglossus kowalevskii]XP_006813663.1 PREDICTED: TNF receptor-associated factor 6-like isoform X2 [Saccoglossus kowalevskii]XP_006813664.1 PREDICTED: TNF receptor-associated factor 6-like isoform X3 [Saccoglossus kowalevskii]
MASEIRRNNVGQNRKQKKEPNQGYDAEFIPELEKKYTCPVCLVAMRDPVQTKCGHRFCKPCMKGVCGNKRYVKCPVDNTWFDSIGDVFDDIATRREVLSLLVLCNYQPNGCEWKGELRELQEHNSICPFEKLTCPNSCSEQFFRKCRENHLEECPRRQVDCKHCGDKMIFNDLMRHELLLCSKFPVSCALCGQHGIIREEIPQHVDITGGDCPNTMIPCTFQHLGCQITVRRCEMNIHCQEASSHHLMLLSNTVLSQKSQLDNAKRELNETKMKYNDLSNKYKAIKKELLDKDCIMNAQTEKLDFLENTNLNGRLLWKMELAEKDGGGHLISPSFYTGCPGYKLSIQVELSAYVGRNETYSSLFVVLEKGRYDEKVQFPFSATCRVTVYDQDGCQNTSKKDFTTDILCSEVAMAPDNGCNENQKRGRLMFMMTSKLTSGQYARDGNVYMNIEVLPASRTITRL